MQLQHYTAWKTTLAEVYKKRRRGVQNVFKNLIACPADEGMKWLQLRKFIVSKKDSNFILLINGTAVENG